MSQHLRPALIAGALALAPAIAGAHVVVIAGRAGGAAADLPPALAAGLPPLPRPSGAKVMAFCDSHSGFNNLITNQILAAPATAKGLIEAAWETDPRFNFDSWYDPGDPWQRVSHGGSTININGANQGMPSDHLVNATANLGEGGAMARLRYALTRAPDIMVLNCGTNSINSGDAVSSATPATAAYVETQLDTILNLNTSHGVWTILSVLYPRADWPSGDPRHQITRDVDTWIRAQAGRAGVAAILDPYAALVSASDPDGVNAALFLEGSAGVHLNARGVQLVSSGYLLPILQGIISAGTVFDQTPANANLWPSSTYGMIGTTGTKTGSPSTGSVATGYNLYMSRNGGGSTQVASKDTANATYNRQIIAITPGATPAWDQSTLTFPTLAVTTASVPAGSWVRAYVRIEAIDAASIVPLLTVSVLNGGGTAVVRAQAGAIDSNQYSSAAYGVNAPSGRGVFWLATKPFQMPADGSAASITATVIANFWTGGYAGGSTVTLTIDRPILRLSADPRPAWNLP